MWNTVWRITAQFDAKNSRIRRKETASKPVFLCRMFPGAKRGTTAVIVGLRRTDSRVAAVFVCSKDSIGEHKMKKENEVVKQIFHSRGEGRPQGSEIFLVRAFNKWLELLLKQKTGQAGDPRQKRSGMTLLFNNGGFTLIELLVVVLIIGILAAVALPQYQKAVYKSRAVEAVTMLKAVVAAEEVYRLATGDYTTDITQLDVEIPTELVSTNVSGAFENKYSYQCKTDGCIARVNNLSMPYFEFKYGNGKKYCHVYGYPTTKNDIAKSICQSMGTLDDDPARTESWFVGKHFLLN